MIFAALVAGFSLGFSLILAIGSQNAFVLRQGLRRSHVLLVCLTCALSDALLIAAGVSGFGYLSDKVPWLGDAMRWGGALFLFIYGLLSFRSALSANDALDPEGSTTQSWKAAFFTCLGLTWLNPHVYLDTVVLLGSVAAQYDGSRFWFGMGAMVSSFVFFFSLGFGARYLAPFFARPRAWQMLDILVGLVMWAIAIKLIV